VPFLRIQNGSDIFVTPAGLAETIENVLESGLAPTMINRVQEQLVLLFEEEMADLGITGIKASASYPMYPAGKDEEISAEMILPYIAITISLGNSEEVGIGRTWSDTKDGVAKAFRQTILIEYDCHGADQRVADMLAGFTCETVEKRKMTKLRHKGFIHFKQNFSRPARGFSFSAPWDFSWRFYPLRVFRHLVYMETKFEVVWIEVPLSEGRIFQIQFRETGEVIGEFNMGNSLQYLLAEEIYLGWHDVFP
jgi:hypothetical protein